MKICVDIGSGRGYVTRHLTGHSIEKLYCLEMSSSWLDQCEIPPEEENIKVEAHWHPSSKQRCRLSKEAIY